MLDHVNTGKSARNIVIVVVVGTLLFGAALGGFLFWYESNEKDAARDASDQMATALQENDPSGAPDGADEYVSGMREYFGPIRDANTVDVRQVDNYGQSSNTADDRSWWTSTIFLRSERGAALVLLTFADTFDPKDAKVESIRELSPRKVAKGALTKVEMRDARRGFASRGGKTANSVVLAGTFTSGRGGSEPEEDVPAAPAEPVPPVDREAIERQREAGQKRLKCVQDAQGDIEKLKKCSKL